MADFRDVDPCELRVPHSRPQGAGPAKLQCQIAQFGGSAAGVPPPWVGSGTVWRPRACNHRASRGKLYHYPWVYEAADGVLVLYNGVTRATRIAKLSPGTLIRVEVVGKLRRAATADPKIGDVLP